MCDLAIAALVVEVLRALVAERWSPRAAQQALPTEEVAAVPLAVILERGPLARRMLAAVGESPDRAALAGLSAQLADCLAAGGVFGV